jgi:hypothetical protein
MRDANKTLSPLHRRVAMPSAAILNFAHQLRVLLAGSTA